MEIRKIYVGLVVFMMLSISVPLAFGATTDSVEIYFNPDGDIDIDVSLATYNFTSFVAQNWKNSTSNTFILWNNGSVAMDTQIETNDSTDEGQMWLNISGVSPITNQYAFKTINLGTADKFLNNTYGAEGYYSQNLASMDNDPFDLGLLLGTNITQNWSWQTTTIYFQGTAS